MHGVRHQSTMYSTMNIVPYAREDRGTSFPTVDSNPSDTRAFPPFLNSEIQNLYIPLDPIKQIQQMSEFPKSAFN